MAELAPGFATLFKQWRQHRRVSQLDLAAEVGVSQRHLSFLETGRANPSQAMVLALAEALQVPLRERNSLLQSAGFASSFSEGKMDADTHRAFKSAIDQILVQQEPFPALVLDGRWNMIGFNPGALRFFSEFIDPIQAQADIGDPADFQIIRLCLHASGLRPYIENWHELVQTFLHRARRAQLANPSDPGVATLIDEILNHPDADQDWRKVWQVHHAPAIEMIMRKGDDRYRLFTMMAHFGAPGDITLEETSVELFYPSDDQTRELLFRLAANG
ncbi:MAG: helix-turn-helix domain-containing protein [Pseudomonadales bacterium]|nr:helix-turn-helix domain-containing protein [Pseudomonadales bacterium]